MSMYTTPMTKNNRFHFVDNQLLRCEHLTMIIAGTFEKDATAGFLINHSLSAMDKKVEFS